MVITEDFREKVRKAARSVTMSGQAEADDVEQDIWVRLLENVDYYNQLAEYEDPFPALKKIAKQEIYKQNNAREHFSGNYTYNPAEVRGLLGEYLFNVELESLCEHVDLVEGMLMLRDNNPTYFKLIVDKWVHGVAPTSSANQTRAVDKLTLFMNKVNNAARYSYQGIGSRKVISNSYSIALTANHSEQDGKARNENNWA